MVIEEMLLPLRWVLRPRPTALPALAPQIRAQRVLIDHREVSSRSILLVTHDLEDAIALADRVLVFSARPAVVQAEIIVDLGDSSRDPLRARTLPKFQEYMQRLLQEVRYL